MVERGFVVSGNRLSGARHAEPASLAGRRERRARRDRYCARGALPSGRGRGHKPRSSPGCGAYAPELKLLGVAAAAPATDLATLMRDDLNSVGGKNITAMTLWSWHRVYGAAIDNVVDPRALPAIDRLAQECIEDPFDLIVRQRTERPLEQYFLTLKDPTGTEPWRSLLKQNSASVRSPGIPVFLAQGDQRQDYPARGDQGLSRQAVQGGQQGQDGHAARHRPRPCRASKHDGGGELADGSVCSQATCKRLP